MPQTDMFEVDHTGRKAALLGLSHDHEILIDVVEEAKRLHGSLARYQIGVVDCQMKKLSSADTSAQLTRLWTDTFVSFSNLGSLLAKYAPVDEAIEVQIRTQASADRVAATEGKKLDTIDEDFRKFMGDNPPQEPTDEERDK